MAEMEHWVAQQDFNDSAECMIDSFRDDMATYGFKVGAVKYTGFSTEDGLVFEAGINLATWLEATKHRAITANTDYCAVSIYFDHRSRRNMGMRIVFEYFGDEFDHDAAEIDSMSDEQFAALEELQDRIELENDGLKDEIMEFASDKAADLWFSLMHEYEAMQAETEECEQEPA